MTSEGESITAGQGSKVAGAALALIACLFSVFPFVPLDKDAWRSGCFVSFPRRLDLVAAEMPRILSGVCGLSVHVDRS